MGVLILLIPLIYSRFLSKEVYFLIDQRILQGNKIEHKPLEKVIETQENWLPEGQILVGVTSGASTPDKIVEAVIERIFEEKNAMVLV